MIRYFINYEDLIENNVINKVIKIDCPELFIIKKHKKNYYKFEPIIHFNKNILKVIRKLNYKKKGLLMVELTKEESLEFDSLFIKTYKSLDNDIYIKDNVINDENIRLINFKTLVNMNNKELRNGNIVAMMPCFSNKNYMYISADRSVLSKEFDLADRRNMLLKENIGCDIYFHTTDEEILDRYKNDITEVKEVDFHTYDLIKHKVFVLDPIGNSEISFFNGENYYCLNVLSKDLTPIYIKNIDNGYLLNVNQKEDYNKKGYIINSIHLSKLLESDGIEPLIKYIGVYELVNGIYVKKSLNEYLSVIKTLKYTRNKVC